MSNVLSSLFPLKFAFLEGSVNEKATAMEAKQTLSFSNKLRKDRKHGFNPKGMTHTKRKKRFEARWALEFYPMQFEDLFYKVPFRS